MTESATLEKAQDSMSSSAPGIELNQVTTTKVVKTDSSISQNGALMQATAKVLGQSEAAVKATVLESGDELLSIPFKKEGFKFDEIFTDFVSEQLEQFIFDDVDIQIEVSAADANALTVNFSGQLRIDSAPMSDVAKALNISQGPILMGQIVTGDKDLSDKITPQAIKLNTAATLEVDLFEGVSLTQTAFELEIEKDATGKWVITPAASGTLQIDDLSSSPVDMPCNIKYADKKLFLNAAIKEAKDLFGVNGLTLDFIEFDSVIGESKSLTLNAALTSGERTFEFAGQATNKNAGIYTKESSFSLNDCIQLVETITGETLDEPDFDIKFGDVLLGFATENGTFVDETLDKGITLQSSISVLDHTCVIATEFNQEGIEFSGNLSPTSFGPVNVEQAKLVINLYKKSANKTNRVQVIGEANIEGVDVECKVAYQKQNNQWQSVLYASLDSDSLSLSKIFPDTKNSFVNSFSFSKAAFIYSSFDSTQVDSDFGISLKQGLQLLANMNQVPALSDLTGDDDLNLVLSAYFGKEKSINIALPDTRLNLGKSVTTSPMTVGVELAPSPALQVVFGMDLTVPKQDEPLHFDLSMNVGAIEASAAGTMKNYWVNPFGVKGLKIGPAVALEVGIIYQQFLTTGTPSTFGIVGGLALGDVIAQMAMKISVNPSDQILFGKIEELSPENLIAFINEASSAGIPKNAVPNFFELKDLELYVAPNGGSIGTVQFDPGFSFNGDLILFDKEISLYARLSDEGIEAQGRIEKLEIGPLSIQGKNGDDTELDLEMTLSKQAVLIDGEIQLFGSGIGIYADVSTSGVEFAFEQSFLGLASYTVEGKSTGNIKQPNTLDFSLLAAFDSQITAYLKNDLTKKIDTAINAVNKDIGEAQQDVDNAEKAYKAEFNKAKADLDNAQKEADKYLKKLQSDLQNEKQKHSKNIAQAKKDVEKAEAAYNSALDKAKKDVTKAQADYTNAISGAQADVDKAKRDYTNAFNKAQADVKKAKADYDKAVNSAQRSLDSAKRKVSSLQSSIDKANKKFRKEKKKTFPNPFKLAALGTEIAGLETAKATATAALNVAKEVVKGVTKGSAFVAFNAANATLEAVKKGGQYAAFETAKGALEAVKQGGKYTAFEAAKATLEAVKKGAELTAWQAAEDALVVADETGKAAIQVAQTSINTVGKSSVYIALEAAKGTLEAVKQGSTFAAFESANVALEAAKKGAGAVLDISKFVAQHSGDLIDVRHVQLSASLKAIQKGDLFAAEIDMSVLGNNFKANIDFDVQDIGKFIENLFKEVFSEAERIAKQII